MSVNIYDKDAGTLTALASGQRTWVGTQEAYKSAKQAGTLPNNAIIAITDDEKDHNHYSTDEVETGMYWIDGKPIYRKVFNVNKTAGASGTETTEFISTSGLNIDQVIELHGVFIFSGTRYSIPFPRALNESNTGVGRFIDIYWDRSYDRIAIGFGSAYGESDTPIITILEYTKTTD